MNFFKKIFNSNKQNDLPQKKKKQKTSFLTWLCATKSTQDQYEQANSRGLQPIGQQSSAKKSMISIAPTSNTKIIQRLSFGNDRKDYWNEQLSGQLISIVEMRINKIEDLIEEDGLYGMINSQEPLVDVEENKGIWLRIGKNQQINSLMHIKPYYFDKLFIIFDEFGGQYSIEEILKSKQNIYLKHEHKSSIQNIIDTYEKQLTQHFAFKLLSQCFSKLKITIIRTNNNHVWLKFNEETQPDIYLDDILRQIGFDPTHEEYENLKEEIPKGLTLQEYMDILEHKEKLLSKYEGQSVGEYIKNKFLQKISSKEITPRNDSPRTVQKQKSNDEERSQGYNEYILSMTANTLPRQKIQQLGSNQQINKSTQKNSFEQQIFEFNVYSDDKEQEAKRVAISKERKKRSRSEDITVNDLHNSDDMDENDYFQRD